MKEARSKIGIIMYYNELKIIENIKIIHTDRKQIIGCLRHGWSEGEVCASLGDQDYKGA